MAKCSNCGGDALAIPTMPYSHNDLCGIPDDAKVPCAMLAAMLGRKPRWIWQRAYGTGQQPEAPAPVAPAELAAKLARYANIGARDDAERWDLREAAAMLTQQAEQLQRQAAVCEAARGYHTAATNQPGIEGTERRRKAWARLTAALAALEATDATNR